MHAEFAPLVLYLLECNTAVVLTFLCICNSEVGRSASKNLTFESTV